MSQRPNSIKKNIPENNTQTHSLIASSRTFPAEFFACRKGPGYYDWHTVMPI